MPQPSAAALQLLRTQRWSGNIRELQNVIEHALILSEDQPVIGPEPSRSPTPPVATRPNAQEFSRARAQIPIDPH